jgi:hypothetical protein
MNTKVTGEESFASCVSSRHVLTEGYLIVYTDGTYLLCMWTDAP